MDILTFRSLINDALEALPALRRDDSIDLALDEWMDELRSSAGRFYSAEDALGRLASLTDADALVERDRAFADARRAYDRQLAFRLREEAA